MIKQIFLWGGLMLASLCASAQSDTLLMRVGHLPVSRGEFLYAYRKNAGALPPSDFLRRFVRLKWRVCQAQTEGLDTTRLFRQQFENCKLRLQKLNRQQQASVSPEAPDTDRRWIAHVCLRIPQSVSYSGTKAWVAKLDSVSAAMPSAGELASWIEQNAGHLPAGWQAEIVCVKPYQLPNELLTRLRLLKPDETSRPFLSAAGVHLIDVHRQVVALGPPGHPFAVVEGEFQPGQAAGGAGPQLGREGVGVGVQLHPAVRPGDAVVVAVPLGPAGDEQLPEAGRVPLHGDALGGKVALHLHRRRPRREEGEGPARLAMAAGGGVGAHPAVGVEAGAVPEALGDGGIDHGRVPPCT